MKQVKFRLKIKETGDVICRELYKSQIQRRFIFIPYWADLYPHFQMHKSTVLHEIKSYCEKHNVVPFMDEYVFV
jgi:hypothetical protein